MASLFVTPSHSSSPLIFPKTPHLHFPSISTPNLQHPSSNSTLSITTTRHQLPSFRLYSTPPAGTNSPDSDPISSSFKPPSEETPISSGITDEWGEKAGPEPEVQVSISVDEDEWGTGSGGNGSAVSSPSESDGRVEDLKRCLVDTVYGMNFGLDASAEVRAEVTELVNQLEAANPTPAPTAATALLDGNWVLVYTAFSELLPLLAASKVPLLKVEKIYQVEFKEGSFKPPVINSSIKLPENLEVFGQTISLLPVQQSLVDPLQGVVANISGIISGQSPLKVSIPGDRTQSWLLTTFLDGDLRISRGDGGLFVLAREGSPLVDQLL